LCTYVNGRRYQWSIVHIKISMEATTATKTYAYHQPMHSNHRDTLEETACRLCPGSCMGLIYCCPIKLGGEISNYTGYLPSHSFPLTLPSSLPFSMPVLGGCQILTLEAPLITEKTPCMYNSYIYSKDDVRSPFVKPP
jgi:hypothetical protein